MGAWSNRRARPGVMRVVGAGLEYESGAAADIEA